MGILRTFESWSLGSKRQSYCRFIRLVLSLEQRANSERFEYTNGNRFSIC